MGPSRSSSEPIPLRLGVPYPVGHVNAYLLTGDPLTLVDTGVRWRQDEAELAAALGCHGVALEQIEQLVLTHHHADHAGLAAMVRSRSGCVVAASAETAARVGDVEAQVALEDAYAVALLALHGAGEPAAAAVAEASDWGRTGALSVAVDRILSEGERLRAGGRDLTVVLRPGHSPSDTVFVGEDGWALLGDHLLASSGSTVLAHRPLEGGDPADRPRAIIGYREGLRQTASLGLARGFAGHGSEIEDPAALVRERLSEHDRRAERALRALGEVPASAWALACELWPAFARDDTPDDGRMRHPVARPWIALSDVLGLLDMLAEEGLVRELRDGGLIVYERA